MKCVFCQKETNNPKFCSRSCAAKKNGELYPKRKRTKKCQRCGVLILSTRKTFCDDCWKYRPKKDRPKKKRTPNGLFCCWYLCNNALKGKQRKFCSKSCAVKSHYREKKKKHKCKALDLLGRKCFSCGVSCVHVLEFHHKNPSEKKFDISRGLYLYSWEKIKKETLKCILLCANCHRQKHAEEREKMFFQL